jgi:eukaryotic-like serine/threonine-protein kinase
LLNLDCAAAQRVLTVAHLSGVCPTANQHYMSNVPAGQVINWSYDNKLNATVAPYGSTILIAISLGPQPVAVPNVAGDTFAAAQSALSGAGFIATQTETNSTSVPSGEVISTDPAAGTQVQPGTSVKVTVSAGPPIVTVPDVTDDSVKQATNALERVGLSLGTVYGPSGGTVFSTTPGAGQQVPEGTSVSLYIH